VIDALPRNGRADLPEAGHGTEAATWPRLTRLELQGFKSFASKTVFAFEPGITAVVGPNGSGKSNVADAVRWVLGEQGYGNLRAKRAEDVIFAGGQGRAPAGLAEATLTFDNRDRWLPIDFAEVTVSRRAFRTGESHYLINGRRVRLKDVALLTASLGQSHVVVGQGLVDAALSQRAEERRALFEHAADLTGLRLKIAEAERNLAEAAANGTRLEDLLAELEPRLKSLERAARQAREWQGVRDRLRELQVRHYRGLLRAAQAAHAAAALGAEREGAALAEAQGTVDRLAAEAEGRAEAVERARAALAEHDARRQGVAEQARRAAHERDLAAERSAALAKRREDMADTRAGLDEQAAAAAAERARLTADLAELGAALAAAEAAAAAKQRAATAARATQAEAERRASALTDALAAAERRGADLTRRRALLDQRRETAAAERERAAAAAAERAGRIARLEGELAAAAAAAAREEAELTTLADRLAELDAAGEGASEAAAAAAAALGEAERQLGQATTRLDVLRRLHESGAGLYAGVRETLGAARAGKLGGIRGTVAELVAAPAELETAVEVALGGHLQDIVVERWADAEAAIARLKRTGAGRATFQPLETVRGRGGSGPRALPREALGLAGVRGIAGDLVAAAPELSGVVDALLGRTLVVADLATARRALPHLPLGWSAVTLAGEIARAGGSVTGGAAVRESGVLGRERELRDLPAEIERRRRQREAATAARAAAEGEARRLAEERRGVEAARAGQAAAGEERRRQRQRLAGWLDELRQEQAVADRRLAALAEGAAAADGEAAALDREAAALAAETDAASREREAVAADLAGAAAAVAAAAAAAGEEGRRLAALEERLRAERRREGALRERERALVAETALRDERAAALDAERRSLTKAHDRLAAEAAALAAAAAELDAGRAPLAALLATAERLAGAHGRALEAARAELLARERAHGAADLAAERARGELGIVRRRIADDLEETDPDALLAAPPSPEGESDAAAGADEAAVAAREREIGRLKERLRRVGYVGEDAVAEFERESAHQAFLRGQLADVQGAAASLRRLLADLDGTLRSRFDATFQRVAAAFEEAFTTLFGGGTARLVLTGSEQGEAPGVDVVAQPPGKRLQSLALLSGGERALTGVALLFAILRVNPAPFCLLDEVDAALDEANVVRFREQLRELASRTQVIVVTHNRGTIETADTLYGVSMAADGVSQVLSLRLAEAAPAG